MRLKPAALLGLCLPAAACAPGYAPQYGPVPQTAAANQGGTVRLILKADGTPVELTHMRVEGDSILGLTGYPPKRYAVATEDVQVIAVRGADTGSPTLAGVGVIALLASAAVLVMLLGLFAELP